MSQQHPLNHAIPDSDMMAVTLNRDGRTDYSSIDARSVVTGLDIRPYLPREFWQSTSRASLYRSELSASVCAVDCSLHSTGIVHLLYLYTRCIVYSVHHSA